MDIRGGKTLIRRRFTRQNALEILSITALKHSRICIEIRISDILRICIRADVNLHSVLYRDGASSISSFINDNLLFNLLFQFFHMRNDADK